MDGNLNMRQAAAKGIVWSAAQRYGERAISFLVLLILARLLTPATFGLVAMASVFIAFAQIFIDQGFGDAVVQALQIDQSLLNTAFWTNLITGILIMLLSVILSDVIADFYDEALLGPLIRWLSISFVFSALSSVQEALLRRRLDFKKLAIRSLIATIGSGLIAVCMAEFGAGVWSLVVKTVLYTFIGVLTLWGISPWRPGFSFSWECFQKLYSYGISIVGAQFVDFFNRRADDLLIGFFLGATMLGYYSLAYSLLVTVTEILIVVPNAVVFPAFSRIRQDGALLRSSVYEATQIISIITIPFFACIIILAPELIQLLYGPQWTQSIAVVQVLMLVGIVHSAFFFFGSLLKAVGKPQWRFAMLSATAVLNVIGFVITVRWGIVAVAISYVCVGYLVAPFYLELVRRATDLSIKVYLKQYLPAMVCTLLMSLVVFTTRSAVAPLPGPYLRLLAIILAGIFSYAFCLFLLARPVFYQVLGIAIQMIPNGRMSSNLISKLKRMT
jgi:PST family polysaccharide transporter